MHPGKDVLEKTGQNLKGQVTWKKFLEAKLQSTHRYWSAEKKQPHKADTQDITSIPGWISVAEKV